MADDVTQKPPEPARAAAEQKPAPKAHGNAQVAQPNRLGLSRWIYGAGYSARDGYIYGIASFIGTFALIFVGERAKIPVVQGVTRKLDDFRKWWEKIKGGIMGVETSTVPIFPLAGVVSFFAGHFLAGPAFVRGMKKSDALIEKHNHVLAEKDQLIESGKLLQRENEELKAKLAAAQGSRPSHAEQVTASAAAAPQLSI